MQSSMEGKLPELRPARIEMLGELYQWFWFHTEFWMTPVDRRPYTFIMRDWIYTHIPYFVTLVLLFYGGMFALSFWYGPVAAFILSGGSFILAHLVWGTKWIEGEQEYPEYLGTVRQEIANVD